MTTAAVRRGVMLWRRSGGGWKGEGKNWKKSSLLKWERGL
jgi:hypothetical protein